MQPVTSSEVWDEATAATYDEDVAAEFAPDVVGPAVDYLYDLVEGGPILEFAIGTGRIGIPLTARGAPVTGLELSEPMVMQLRRKVDEETLPVVIGDMARATVPGEFSLVLLVFNSISNLRTQQEQVECFRNAARHLRAGGRFVIELWVPNIQSIAPGTDAGGTRRTGGVRHLRSRHAGVHLADVSRQADGTLRHDLGHFRYLWPSECDLMASLATRAPRAVLRAGKEVGSARRVPSTSPSGASHGAAECRRAASDHSARPGQRSSTGSPSRRPGALRSAE